MKPHVPAVHRALDLVRLVVPPDVATATTPRNLHCRLAPLEAAVIRRAVPAREQEFIAGRSCARQALHRLGAHPDALTPNLDGMLGWPRGTVGSITHCSHLRVAVAAWRDRYAGVGIDAELNRPLPPRLIAIVAAPSELAAAREAVPPSVAIDRLIFSAKEAAFKALPEQRTFDEKVVSELVVRFNVGNEFVAATPHARVQGRWAASAHIVTFASMRRSGERT